MYYSLRCRTYTVGLQELEAQQSNRLSRLFGMTQGLMMFSELSSKKKKDITSFCQPTRLITCAKEWQEQQMHLFAHEVKAVNNEVKDPSTPMPSGSAGIIMQDSNEMWIQAICH